MAAERTVESFLGLYLALGPKNWQARDSLRMLADDPLSGRAEIWVVRSSKVMDTCSSGRSQTPLVVGWDTEPTKLSCETEETLAEEGSVVLEDVVDLQTEAK